MIKLENVVLASPDQMEFIIQGMRNPYNSWEKSDSKKGYSLFDPDEFITSRIDIGPNDRSLMQRLAIYTKVESLIPLMNGLSSVSG